MNLKICLNTLGLRGDVKPFLMLALYLKEMMDGGILSSEGNTYKPVIFSSINNRAWVESHGIEFHSLIPRNIDGLIEKNFNSKSIDEYIRMVKITEHDERDMVEKIMKVCHDADLIISNYLSAGYSMTAAEALDKPFGLLLMDPIHQAESLKFHDKYATDFHQLWNKFIERGSSASKNIVSPSVVKIRKEFKLKKGKISPEYFQSLPAFYAIYSRPLGGKPKDWGENVRIGGYFDIFSTDEKLPEELQAFPVRRFEKVVCMTFGSMFKAHQKQVINLIQETLFSLDIKRFNPLHYRYKIILNVGYPSPLMKTVWRNEIEEIPVVNLETEQLLKQLPSDRVFSVVDVAYNVLFPKCDAIIHHGGSGAVMESIIAGVPQFVVPVSETGYFWAEVVNKLNGENVPEWTFLSRMNGERMNTAIQALFRSKYRAQNLQDKILSDAVSTENGVDNAVKWFDELMSSDRK